MWTVVELCHYSTRSWLQPINKIGPEGIFSKLPKSMQDAYSVSRYNLQIDDVQFNGHSTGLCKRKTCVALFDTGGYNMILPHGTAPSDIEAKLAAVEQSQNSDVPYPGRPGEKVLGIPCSGATVPDINVTVVLGGKKFTLSAKDLLNSPTRGTDLCTWGISLASSAQVGGLTGCPHGGDFVSFDLGNVFMRYFYWRFYPYRTVVVNGKSGVGQVRVSTRNGDPSPLRQATAADVVNTRSVEELRNYIEGTITGLSAATLAVTIVALLASFFILLLILKMRYLTSEKQLNFSKRTLLTKGQEHDGPAV